MRPPGPADGPVARDVPCKIHGEYDHGEFITFLQLGNDILSRTIPGEIGNMNQPVNTTFNADKYAEVGDGADLAGHDIALLVQGGELLPGVRRALLHAQRDAAAP